MRTVVSVRFRGGSKNYYFDPGELTVESGTEVIVETSQGTEYALCVEGNHEVEDTAVVEPLCPVLRIATENDRAVNRRNMEKEKEAAEICQKKILQHGLDMKLVDVSCAFDGNKIIFFFTSDGRVDFRELVKDLASVFRARIELRQIGVRDEAKMLGGLGICGRPFCCASFLDGFLPVSIKMAKTQNLSLNPTKISGTCGRLMCCLKYEQDAYEDAVKRMPKNESFVLTPDGPGNVTGVDLLHETAKVSLDGTVGAPKSYHNCELCVLRNGKGSREGIEIPSELPERYVSEEEKLPIFEECIPELISSDEPEQEETEEPNAKRERRRGGRRHRGGRGGKVTKVPSHVEEGEKTEKPAEKKQAEKPEKNPAEKKVRADKKVRPEKAEKAEKSAAAPAEQGESGEKRNHRRRPHHRGGRRHHGGSKSGEE